MKNNSKAKSILEKTTGVGEKLSDVEAVQIKEQEFRDKMIEYISSLVNSAKERNCKQTITSADISDFFDRKIYSFLTDVQKLQFYVIHVNIFYSRTLENNEVEYYPAEVAIAEFSLEKGVLRTYCEIINEKVRIGFASTAKECSANSHQIPINASFGKNDYIEIFRDICNFLSPGEKGGVLPPLYTMFTKESAYCPAKSFLSKLAIANRKNNLFYCINIKIRALYYILALPISYLSSERIDDYLLLYSLEELFATVHNAAVDQTGISKIEPLVASMELKKDLFAYKTGLECEVSFYFRILY